MSPLPPPLSTKMRGGRTLFVCQA